MPPVPLAVMDLSSDMVVKLRLKVVAETVWAEAGADLAGHARKYRRDGDRRSPSVLTFFEISMLFPFATSDEVEQLEVSEPTTIENVGAVATCSDINPA